MSGKYQLSSCSFNCIITDRHEILLFSLCNKSTIVVFKMTKRLSEETEAVLFVSREIIRGNIIKRAK